MLSHSHSSRSGICFFSFKILKHLLFASQTDPSAIPQLLLTLFSSYGPSMQFPLVTSLEYPASPEGPYDNQHCESICVGIMGSGQDKGNWGFPESLKKQLYLFPQWTGHLLGADKEDWTAMGPPRKARNQTGEWFLFMLPLLQSSRYGGTNP